MIGNIRKSSIHIDNHKITLEFNILDKNMLRDGVVNKILIAIGFNGKSFNHEIYNSGNNDYPYIMNVRL